MVAPVEARSDSRFLRICLALLPAFSAFMWVGESNSNLYAFGEYFLTYKHGFVKRGLTGELLSHLGYISAQHVQWIEVASLTAAVLVSYLVFRKLLSRSLDTSLLAVLVLCSPACLPHLGLLAAQPDVFQFLLLLLAYRCLVRVEGFGAPLLAVIPCAVALFVHEGFLLLFYPTILVLLWDGCRNHRFQKLPVGLHVLAVAGLFLWILRHGKIRIDPLIYYSEAHARTDVAFDPAIFFVLTNSLHTQIQATMIGYTPAFLAGVCMSALLLLPAVVGIAVILFRLNRTRVHPLPWAGIVLLFLVPLGLTCLGHDVMRWVAGSVVGLTLLLAYIAETESSNFALSFPRVRQLAVGVILYGFAVGPLGGASIRVLVQTLQMLQRPQ